MSGSYQTGNNIPRRASAGLLLFLLAFVSLVACNLKFPKPITCGDGLVDENEACDDGNQLDGDGCSGDCRVATRYFVRHADRSPLIDGNLDEYEGAQRILLANELTGAMSECRYLWDATGLYLGIEAQDHELSAIETEHEGETWKDDGFDLMLDTENNGGTDHGQPGDFHIIVSIMGVTTDSGDGEKSWDPNLSIAVIMEGTVNDRSDVDQGYRIEFFLSWSDMGIDPPRAGDIWGMDVSLNDRFNDEYRQDFWWNSTGAGSNDPEGWGDMVFLGSRIQE